MACAVQVLRSIPVFVWPVTGCISLFLILFGYLFRLGRGTTSVYFDPQDFVHYERGAGRELPVSAEHSTFEPHLKNYVDVVKLLITVAAASIAFGANQNPNKTLFVAKLILGFAILYGVLFCALLQYFYEQYGQDVRAYTRLRYALIQALGFSALGCFVVGYFVWAFKLV